MIVQPEWVYPKVWIWGGDRRTTYQSSSTCCKHRCGGDRATSADNRRAVSRRRANARTKRRSQAAGFKRSLIRGCKRPGNRYREGVGCYGRAQRAIDASATGSITGCPVVGKDHRTNNWPDCNRHHCKGSIPDRQGWGRGYRR